MMLTRYLLVCVVEGYLATPWLLSLAFWRMLADGQRRGNLSVDGAFIVTAFAVFFRSGFVSLMFADAFLNNHPLPSEGQQLKHLVRGTWVSSFVLAGLYLCNLAQLMTDAYRAGGVGAVIAMSALVIFNLILGLRAVFATWSGEIPDPEPEEFEWKPKQALPRVLSFPYSADDADAEAGANEEGWNETTCAICLENYTAGVTLGELPCKHRFHKECIDAWLKGYPRYHCPKRCPNEYDDGEPTDPREPSALAAAMGSAVAVVVGEAREEGEEIDEVNLEAPPEESQWSPVARPARVPQVLPERAAPAVQQPPPETCSSPRSSEGAEFEV